jgi:hypothetical protein
MVIPMDDLYMKAATVIAVALAAFSSFPSPAQQQQGQQPVQQVQPETPQGQTNDGNRSAAAAQLTPVSAELMSKLDSKSAKQGDSVVVKTREDLKFPGGTDLPKGSKLIGHITNVQARVDGKENSQIAIQFDHAELKGGQDMAIESVIRSISPAEGAGNTTDNSVPAAYGANPGVQSAQGGATSSGQGSAGSANGSASAANPNSRPGLASNTTAQPGTTDQTTGTGMPAPGSIVARNGNVAIRATAIPGVLLANDINGLPFTNASGMLLGARRDIHLDGGTQMVVAVAAAPQGAGGMSR